MNFSAAKTVFSILSGIGWLLILGGIIIVFLDVAPAAMAVGSGLTAAISGAIILAVAQMGTAQIVTAETNTKILAILSVHFGIPGTSNISMDPGSIDAVSSASPGRMQKMGEALGRGLKRK